MSRARGPTFALGLACLIAHPVADANADGYAWLMKINQATRELSYEGTFVYQNNGQLEAMRIVHSVDNGSMRERVVSLNGAAREVIRDERQVMCYLPDRQSVMVEHRLGREKSFPVILPESVSELDKNYLIELGRSGRVAGRKAQSIVIKPRDKYRYGYHLWGDKQTGLLLKADLVNPKGKVLEQFMFTQVTIGGAIDPEDLRPSVATEGLAWYWGDTTEPGATDAAREWTAKRLPVGFMLVNRLVRKHPTRDSADEHLVYSDGLAAVSVFINQGTRKSEPKVNGPSHMGAVHVYGKVVEGHQIIVVGEVPEETVEMIGESVKVGP
jgi:sigma-E factor negative regulatory protein RseB